MKIKMITLGIAMLFLTSSVYAAALQYSNEKQSKQDQSKTWSIKADYIEACSCNMFCMCYFNSHPDGEMFCEFNNVIKVVSGHYGNIKLDGVLFWMAGDLGGDFTKNAKWVALYFDPKTTKEQREAIQNIIPKIYPLPGIDKLIVDEAPIVWKKDGKNGYAKLGDGIAEVVLTGITDANGKPTVINNLKYWGAEKNNGFVLAYSKHYFKGHGYDYAHERRNGFFIHIESSGTLEK